MQIVLVACTLADNFTISIIYKEEAHDMIKYVNRQFKDIMACGERRPVMFALDKVQAMVMSRYGEDARQFQVRLISWKDSILFQSSIDTLGV